LSALKKVEIIQKRLRYNLKVQHFALWCSDNSSNKDSNLNGGCAEKVLASNGDGAALGLLADGSTDGDEISDTGRYCGGVSAVQVCDTEDICGAALRGAFEA